MILSFSNEIIWNYSVFWTIRLVLEYYSNSFCRTSNYSVFGSFRFVIRIHIRYSIRSKIYYSLELWLTLTLRYLTDTIHITLSLLSVYFVFLVFNLTLGHLSLRILFWKLEQMLGIFFWKTNIKQGCENMSRFIKQTQERDEKSLMTHNTPAQSRL